MKTILSLTSYSKRILSVHETIKTLLNQTYKVDHLILWLAEDEFTLDNLPQSLLSLQKEGLEILFCEDIKSYKKLIPTLKLYPDDIIITFDDDAYYKKDVVEKLMHSYNEYPDCIHCLRGREIIYDQNMLPLSYNQWEMISDNFIPGHNILPTGLGGILYPPNCFYKDILRKDIFMKLTPRADDIWFKVMGLINGYKARVVPQKNKSYSEVTLIPETQDIGLWITNKEEETGNNPQIRDVFNYYHSLLIFNSKSFWEERYLKGGNSGAGSYNHLAEFKANIINKFIQTNNISRVLEFGCGDGNNLSLYKVPNYIGIDVSFEAIKICQTKFVSDKTKQFLHESKLPSLKKNFQVTLSLDVIYHLIEDSIFNAYMTNLFTYATQYVIIYSSNKEERHTAHVMHREFTQWIKQNQPKWNLIEKIDNIYPYDESNPTKTAFADFYIYKKGL